MKHAAIKRAASLAADAMCAGGGRWTARVYWGGEQESLVIEMYARGGGSVLPLLCLRLDMNDEEFEEKADTAARQLDALL